MQEVKPALGQLLPLPARVDSMLASTPPHLATKAEMEEVKSELAARRTTMATEQGFG